SDNDRVDILPRQDVGVMHDLLRLFSRALFHVGRRLLPPLAPGIAHGYNFEVGVLSYLDQLFQQASPSAADVGNPNTIVHAGQSPIRRCRHGYTRRLHELSSIDYHSITLSVSLTNFLKRKQDEVAEQRRHQPGEQEDGAVMARRSPEPGIP